MRASSMWTAVAVGRDSICELGPRRLSGVQVDGGYVGVELDRRASLLVRPPPRRLDAAEWDVDRGSRCCRVDVDDARLYRADEPLCGSERAGEDRGREPVLDGVGASHGLIECREAEQRGDRPKDLRARKLRRVVDVLEQAGATK